MSLEATDAPFVHDIVTEASITVDEITAHTSASAESGFVTLYDGAPITFDLMELQDGQTRLLVEAGVPVGDYRQIRLHVTDAQLVLVNGNVYSTANGDLHLTSQGTSGFKVFVDPPVEIRSNETTRMVLDFDLTKTFHPIPSSGDPLDADSFNLHPVIHAANLATTGILRGTVTMAGVQGPQSTAEDGSPTAAGARAPIDLDIVGAGVGGATVYVFLPGETDPANSVASTATNALGSYTVLGLEPGTYDVLAVKGALDGRVDGIVITASEETVVDIAID